MSPSSKDITRKAIGDRLRQVREAPPYWSRPDLARLLRAAADPADRAGLPHVKPLAEMIKHWENGKHAPGDRYRPLYAKVTGIAKDELFAVDTADVADCPVAAPAWPAEDVALLDLAAQAGASDLPAGTLELLDDVVDRL